MLLRLPRFCSASGMFADAGTVELFARMRGSSNSLLRVVAEDM